MPAHGVQGLSVEDVVEGRPAHFLDAELFDFLVVVLAVEDVPLLTAFGDDAALGLDLEAGGLVDAHLLQ